MYIQEFFHTEQGPIEKVTSNWSPTKIVQALFKKKDFKYLVV